MNPLEILINHTSNKKDNALFKNTALEKLINTTQHIDFGLKEEEGKKTK